MDFEETYEELFLARLGQVVGNIYFDVGEGPSEQEVVVHGEILVAGRVTDDGSLLIESFRRVAMRSQPIEELQGALSLIGPTESHSLYEQTARFPMNLYYPRLNELGAACTQSDAVFPYLERLACDLGWQRLEPSTLQLELGEIPIEVTELALSLESAHLAEELDLSLDPFPLTFRRMEQQPPLVVEENSLTPCAAPEPAGVGHEHRHLNVRFVNLSSSVSTDAALESMVQEWLDVACHVWWEKGGIKIVPKPDIDTASFHDGNITSAAWESDVVKPPTQGGVGHDPNRIDVYLADELNPDYGGGVTKACGTSDAYILLEIEKARRDKGLLAHELGHVFGLRHPGEGAEDGCTNYREGSFCSVMVPSKPKSFRNTENNLLVTEMTSYPLVPNEFVSLGYTAGWDADLEEGFFHIVRDFPYDDGTEASVPESPFTNWWSHSDVWNSHTAPDVVDPQAIYSDGSPMFDADHSPVHTEPRCIGANYMYVRLHACEPLNHPVDVDLYLADPGISPGSANLVPLVPPTGGVPNHRLTFAANEVRPALPRTKPLEWRWSDVPVGYPKNCCVFSIVHSAEEPSPFADPTAVTFGDVFPLLGADNDIAQRNLHVQTCTTIADLPLSTLLPWVQLANPFDEPVLGRLEVEVAPSVELEALVLEVNGEPLDELEWEGTLQRGDRRIVRLRATLPKGAKVATEFPIDLRLWANGQLITGYRHVLRVAPLVETVAQVLDTLFDALRDVRAGFLASQASADLDVIQDNLAKLVAASGADDDAEKSLVELARLGDRFLGVEDAVESSPLVGEPEHGGTLSQLQQLADRLVKVAMGATHNRLAPDVVPSLFAEEIREWADRIQQPAGRLARRLQAG